MKIKSYSILLPCYHSNNTNSYQERGQRGSVTSVLAHLFSNLEKPKNLHMYSLGHI